MKSAAKKRVSGEGQRKEERAEQNRGGWARVSTHESPIVKDDPRRFILHSNDISYICLSLGISNEEVYFLITFIFVALDQHISNKVKKKIKNNSIYRKIFMLKNKT